MGSARKRRHFDSRNKRCGMENHKKRSDCSTNRICAFARGCCTRNVRVGGLVPEWTEHHGAVPRLCTGHPNAQLGYRPVERLGRVEPLRKLHGCHHSSSKRS